MSDKRMAREMQMPLGDRERERERGARDRVAEKRTL
jgi:hypothetical protein